MAGCKCLRCTNASIVLTVTTECELSSCHVELLRQFVKLCVMMVLDETSCNFRKGSAL